MSFIDELVLMHSELESPRNFWYWAGLCAISAVVKDQVYIDREAFKTYPNIYVMLYALSGMKKGPPINLAKTLVTAVNNTRVIVGRSSIQGILKELGTAYSTPGRAPVLKSCGFICASEFSSSIVSDPAAMTILTDLYDRNYNEGNYKSLLKMESFQLKDPTISMLVGINNAHFADFIESKDLHGGFIGRTFIIAEKDVQRLNPLLRKMTIAPDKDKLISYLKELEQLRGPFELSDSVMTLYEDWYMSFYNNIKSNSIKDDTGTIQRFGDSVLKVAMLLALSEAPELTISPTAMQGAIDNCEKLLGDVRKATLGKEGQANTAAVKVMIIEELLRRPDHVISRSMLAKKLWTHINTTELDEIMVSFNNADMIINEQHGNEIVYRMPEKQAKELSDYLKGRNN